MYFVATLQPAWAAARDPDYNGTFLTRKEKLENVRNFRQSMAGSGIPNTLPICMEHADGAEHGFTVPKEKVLGEVTGMLLTPQDDLLVSGYIYPHQQGTHDIFTGLRKNGERWGLSPWTDFEFDPARPFTTTEDGQRQYLYVKDGTKRITHAGLTRNPALGEEGSWIHAYGTSEEAVSRWIRENEVAKGALANGESLRRWGVAPDDIARTVSVLEENINQDPMSATPTPAAEKPAQAKPDAPAEDKMEVDAPAPTPAATATATATPASPEAFDMKTFVDAVLKVFEDTKNVGSDVEREKKLSHLYRGVRQALRENNKDLFDLPQEARMTVLNIESEIDNIHKRWSEEVPRMGLPEEDANKVQEMIKTGDVDNEARRAQMLFVAASANNRSSSQKQVEEMLMKERAKREEAENALKRKRDAEREVDSMSRQIQEEMSKRRAIGQSPTSAYSHLLSGAAGIKPQERPVPAPASVASPSANEEAEEIAPPIDLLRGFSRASADAIVDPNASTAGRDWMSFLHISPDQTSQLVMDRKFTEEALRESTTKQDWYRALSNNLANASHFA